MKREVYEKLFGSVIGVSKRGTRRLLCRTPAPHEMGLAPGARMRQPIYDDYGLDAWDERHTSRCFVTIANSMQWLRSPESTHSRPRRRHVSTPRPDSLVRLLRWRPEGERVVREYPAGNPFK